MARPRASDHDDKRAALLDKAASLFATRGYDRTSMNEIARAMGVSKALFYHYYRSKNALLFDIIRGHLVELVEAAEAALARGSTPEKRLGHVVRAILDCYRGADSEHKIQINQLSRLSEPEQAELKRLERRLVEIVGDIVAEVNPDLPRDLVRPVAMSMFGTLNWKYMWFRENGAMSHDDYAEMVTRMFVAAARAAGAIPSPAKREKVARSAG
jgi:TetR/AcrR family transcriptional regulator